MHFTKTISFRNVYIIYIAVHTIVYTSWLLWLPEGTAKNIGAGIFSIAGPLISTLLIFKEWRRGNQREKIFWGLIFFGTFAYLVAEVLWNFHVLIFSEDPNYPGINDIFYLLHPVLLLFALIYLVTHNEHKESMAITIIDVVVTMIVITALSWYFIIEPIYSTTGPSKLEMTVSILYPLLELLILFGLFHVRFLLNMKTISSGALNVFTIAILLYFAVDSAFLYLTANDLYASGSLLDPLWTLVMFLLGLSALYPVEDQSGKTFAWIKKYINPHLLHIFSIIILSVLFIPYILSTSLLLFIFVVSILLILVRQYLMLRENLKLNQLLNRTAKILEEKNAELEKTIRELETLNHLREIEAKTDFLTGLYNRRFIEQILHSFIEEAKCNVNPFSILLIDVDHFKTVNDQFGHDIGDKVLSKIAYLFQKSIRKSDVIGRFGGEEFIIILPNTELTTAVQIAERMRQYIENYPFRCSGFEIHITVSIGVTSWQAEDSFDGLYKRVDQALYEAKINRNKVVIRV